MLSGDVKRIGVFGDDTYKLVLSAQRADVGEPHNTYQLVLDENGGHFGHQSGNNYSFLWWIATTKYVDDKIKIIESPEFTLEITTAMAWFRYSLSIPDGYTVVSKELVRLDGGTFNLLFSLPVNHNYITYISNGVHTITGKVLCLCVKS